MVSTALMETKTLHFCSDVVISSADQSIFLLQQNLLFFVQERYHWILEMAKTNKQAYVHGKYCTNPTADFSQSVDCTWIHLINITHCLSSCSRILNHAVACQISHKTPWLPLQGAIRHKLHTPKILIPHIYHSAQGESKCSSSHWIHKMMYLVQPIGCCVNGI